MNAPVQKSIHDLRSLLQDLPRELHKIPESAAAKSRADGGWSRKQILGHLIDSASVNHQRFVRAQLELSFTLFYDTDRWVNLQRYGERPWQELIELWSAFNRQLLRSIEFVPDDKLKNDSGRGSNPSWTLEDCIGDYMTHLQHHLEQIRNFK